MSADDKAVLCLKKFLFCLLFWKIFSLVKHSRLTIFSFSTLMMMPQYLLDCIVSNEKSFIYLCICVYIYVYENIYLFYKTGVFVCVEMYFVCWFLCTDYDEVKKHVLRSQFSRQSVIWHCKMPLKSNRLLHVPYTLEVVIAAVLFLHDIPTCQIFTGRMIRAWHYAGCCEYMVRERIRHLFLWKCAF